jgi:hypothetical protein
MCTALQILGLRSYHWNEVLSNKNNNHMQLWLEALEAKYDGIGKEFSGRDFDRMLWDYQALSDEPCCFFVEELIAAYPGAKVVLTTRTRESWLKSMRASILAILSWRSWPLLALLDRDFTAPYWALLSRTTSILSQGRPAHRPSADGALLESFDRHCDHVRAVVPAGNLLEFHPSHGWEPLCSFLGEPVPDVPFPNLNEPKSLLAVRSAMYWSRWRVVARHGAVIVGAFGTALAAVVWLRWD